MSAERLRFVLLRLDRDMFTPSVRVPIRAASRVQVMGHPGVPSCILSPAVPLQVFLSSIS